MFSRSNVSREDTVRSNLAKLALLILNNKNVWFVCQYEKITYEL